MKIFRIESENSRISIENSERIGFKFTSKEGESTDSIIHNWVIENLSGKNADLIFVPVSIDPYHTNFLGLLLGLHIRLTSEIGAISRCQIVFYSYIPLEIICKISENYHIIFSKGSRFFRIEKDDLTTFLSGHVLPLNDNEYEVFLENIEVKIPRSLYNDNHSVANIWGVQILNQVSNAGVKLKSNYTNYLYFKWITQKFHLFSNDLSTTLGITENLFLLQRKIALIDDEYEKGWSDVLSKVIEKFGGSLVVFDNFKDINKNEIGYRVKQFVESNIDIDICLVDLRFFEDDHRTNIKPNEISGVEVIKVIKAINKGIQVIAFTASNKIWNLDIARHAGADGYYIKEMPEIYTPEKAYENYERFLDEVKRLLSRADNLKPLWQNNEWVKNNLNFSPITPSMTSLSVESAMRIIEEYEFLFETLNRINTILSPEKQQLRYCILILVKILETLRDEYIKYNRKFPIKFKNNKTLNLYQKSNSNTYSATAPVNNSTYKSIANAIKAIDYQLFIRNKHQCHIQIGMLIDKRNELIHEPADYTLNLNNIIEWQTHVFELLQAASRFRW